MIVLSPHLDDAVWSCHELLLEHPDATVITICAGTPPINVGPTQFDTRAGFRTAADAMITRRSEDLAAAELVGFAARHLTYLDNGYDHDQRLDDAVAAALTACRADELVVGPLGLHHPDHVRVAEAFRHSARQLNLNAWVYEELPYAYTHHAEVGAALLRADVPGYSVTRPTSAGKHRAAATYASQANGWHIDAILAPERYHPLTRDWWAR